MTLASGPRLFPTEPVALDDVQRARIRTLADAIAERVAGDQDLMLSVYGMAMGVLVDSMIRDPDGTYGDLRPILRFVGQGLDFAETGIVGADLAAFLPDL